MNFKHPLTCGFMLALNLSLMATVPATGAPLVYEPFNYGQANATRTGSALLDGQPDGVDGDVNATGLGGVWTDSSAVTSTTDLFMASGSLVFGDLPTAGNHTRSDTNSNLDIMSRPITSDLSTGVTDLWVSFLANKLQNNFSAAQEGIVIGNQTVNNAKVNLDTGSTGLAGFGIAPTSAGNNWTAYGWNGSSQVVGGASLGVAVNGSEVHMLVGHIAYDTGTAGADVFTLYEYLLSGSNTVAGGSLSLITSLEVDVTQSSLDTLSLTRQVNTAYDEIRIGQSLDEVLGVIPEPATLVLLGLGTMMVCSRRKTV
ncbi:MAG: PEP-CTERM sorting domain-containing protein [Phycisphaera sp.]|nr:PEP-CTERM sorting domain-containing protein [Phycisphaera sp.]